MACRICNRRHRAEGMEGRMRLCDRCIDAIHVLTTERDIDFYKAEAIYINIHKPHDYHYYIVRDTSQLKIPLCHQCTYIDISLEDIEKSI